MRPTRCSRAPSSAPGRPRRDLRVGPGGARPDHRRDGAGRRPDQARRERRRRRSPRSTPTRPTSCTAPTRCKAWMQEQGRRGHRRPGRHATSTSPTRCARIECLHRADPDRRHLLHRPERGLHPPRPHVVVGAQGRHRVRHLARAHHRLPRGRARAITSRSPRPCTAPSCSTSWRRIASGRRGHGEGWALYAERLMAELGYMDDPGNRLGLLDGQSLRAARVVIDIGVHCGLRGAGRGRRRRVGLRQGVAVPHRPRQPGRGLAAVRARPLPRLAGPGTVATRSASGSGCSCATRSEAARATRSTSRSSTAGRSTSAASASTPCAAVPGELD